MRLGVLNECMVVHKQKMLPDSDYQEPYMSFNQYIPVCTWYVLGTYQYVLESPKSF
jgi:hypothetical protein